MPCVVQSGNENWNWDVNLGEVKHIGCNSKDLQLSSLTEAQNKLEYI